MFSTRPWFRRAGHRTGSRLWCGRRWQREFEHDEPRDGGQQRAGQDAEPVAHHRFRRLAFERERSDEEAHGEADSAEQGDAVDLPQVDAFRQSRETEPDRGSCKGEYAQLLADEEPEHYAERDRLEQVGERQAREADAGNAIFAAEGWP
jgi:hypothetical protein